MERNTSILLGSHFDSFITGQVTGGRYKDASEVIRAGLRLLEEDEDRVMALRNAIQEGIDSGRAGNFNPETYLVQLKETRNANGKLSPDQ